MQPWLSVVMPVHNGQDFLAATLASVEAERPDGVEFILLDSSDDPAPTRRIALAATSLNLQWIASPDDRPWQTKTNRAVEMARAPHVAMLHQDDIWLPGHLASLRASIASAPRAALSVGPSVFIDQTGRQVGRWRLPFPSGQQSAEVFLSTLIVQNTVAIPAPLILREAWLATGGLERSLWYTADWDLYLKLARFGLVYVRSECTTGFRIHGNSLTVAGSRDARAFREQFEQVLARHLPAATACATRTDRVARTSALLNWHLAAAFHDQRPPRKELATALISLGPIGLYEFLTKTRLVDRVLPRLRLHLRGAFG